MVETSLKRFRAHEKPPSIIDATSSKGSLEAQGDRKLGLLPGQGLSKPSLLQDASCPI